MNRIVRTPLVAAALVLAASTPLAQHVAVHEREPRVLERLFVATAQGSTPASGALVRLRGGPPWSVSTLAGTDGATRLRRFDGRLYAVNPEAGTITRFPGAKGARQVYDLGPTSEPQDVHVPIGQSLVAPQAWVTRRHDPFLLRFNLEDGLGSDVVDLSPVGAGAPIALGTLERDGSRLFVQVRVFGEREDGPSADTGVLAVVDLTTLSLIDVEPLTPGVQGIALQGAPPRLKMQILGRTLYVSTTDDLLDNRGGIETVDLDALESTGFALHESQTADMGGFVMTSPDAGFFVFHTDLLASTHLMRFTTAGGPDPGPEIIVLLGDTVDSLAYDPVWRRVFLPSGHAFGSPPGLWVVDAPTKDIVGGAPVDTGLRPHDVLVAD